jgi:hypothetical protein
LAAGEPLGRDADDRERTAVDAHGASDDGGIRAEARAPQRIAEHDDHGAVVRVAAQ